MPIIRRLYAPDDGVGPRFQQGQADADDMRIGGVHLCVVAIHRATRLVENADARHLWVDVLGELDDDTRRRRLDQLARRGIALDGQGVGGGAGNEGEERERQPGDQRERENGQPGQMRAPAMTFCETALRWSFWPLSACAHSMVPQFLSRPSG